MEPAGCDVKARCHTCWVSKAACLLLLAVSSLPATSTAHSAPQDPVRLIVNGIDVQDKQRWQLLAAYDYDLSEFRNSHKGVGGAVDWEGLSRIGPDVPLAQFSNVSVHRHPWLGTVITICFLLGIVTAILLLFG
jgi:hypothetical protein